MNSIKKFLKNEYFIISIGSIIGALVRWKSDDIFIANNIGCFLLGFINNLSLSRKLKLLLGFSFCGSLTTFSSWIFELFDLLKKGLFIDFLSILLLSLMTGYVLIFAGYKISGKIKTFIYFK